MTRVLWTDNASRNVEEIHKHIARDRPRAAAAFAEAILSAGNSLEILPRRGRDLGEDLRELTHLNPYLIRYRYDPQRDEVSILTVWHGARETP